jgi:DNA-binding NtrC family response regulator
MGRILIADDHDSLRRGLAQAIAEAGHEIEEAPNGNAAIEKLHEGFFDVVVSDLKMGGSTGLEVLKTAKQLHPTTAVILMTAFGSVSTAVEAIKSGAFDYVQKPFEIEEMEVKIEKALEMRRMQHQIDYLRHAQGDIYDFERIIGSSGALEKVLAVVRKVAKSNTTVLVRGETGTGKELIAGAIHHNSHRAARNFIKVNCAALQENLLESELFGHEKGAFTGADKQRIGRFEQADGGTLFLDEIGDMSANTQAKILRVLQEHEFERLGGTRTIRVDVRLIAATNRDLPSMVEAGTSARTCITVSTSSRSKCTTARAQGRHRRAGGLLHSALCGRAEKENRGPRSDALKLLMRYNWPGNIRELENAIERAMLLAERSHIAVEDLRLGDTSTTGTTREASSIVKIPPTGIALEEIERLALVEALKMSNWVQKDAAELLAISPRVMNYKIKTLGIDFPRGRRARPQSPSTNHQARRWRKTRGVIRKRAPPGRPSHPAVSRSAGTIG